MRVLLTGATGFIGQVIHKKLLTSGYEIHVISRQVSTTEHWWQVDLFNYAQTETTIKSINADVLIHLAWDVTHGVFWTAAINSNYAEASKHLFSTFIRNGGKKIISSGTCAEYPSSSMPMQEDLIYKGDLTPYGNAKLEVCNFLKQLNQEHQFDYTWFRIFGLYGPKEHPSRFIPHLIRSIKHGEEFNIKNPAIFTDYVFVDDLADFIAACIGKDINGVINVGTGVAVSLSDLFNSIRNFVQTGQYILYKSITDPDANSRIPDCSKLHNNGFNFNFESGLKTTIEHAKEICI